MLLTEFWTIASGNGIVLEKKQIDQIERYAKELVYWNEKVNLISRKDEENVLERHILHSLALLKYVDIPKKSRCLDIGTGGGLPGIPLSIACDDIFMLMVDSIGKKAKLTDMFAKHTGLRNISAMNTRTELLAKEKKYISSFDFIFARAVTRTADIMSWSEKLLKPKGKYVLYKGGDISQELMVAKEKFPDFEYQVIDIDFFGFPVFKAEEKKVLIIQRSK